MKKKIALIVLCMIATVSLLFGGLVACGGGEEQELQPLQAIEITGKPDGTVDLSEGSIQLGISSTPSENVEKFSVNWSSNTQSVASIDKDGKVTLISAGRTTIMAKVIGKEEIKDSFSLEVTSDEIEVSSIAITGIPEGGQVAEDAQPFKLGYEYAPENASAFSVEWYSSTSSVATVDKEGLVTIVGKGATTIRLTVRGTDISDEFVLVVGTMPQIEEIQITSFPSDNSLRAGSKWQLGYTYAPEDCAYFVPQWESENEEVAVIAENGMINALTVGSTKITLSVPGTEAKDEFTLTVTEPLDPLCEDFETANIAGSVGSGNYASITNNYTGVSIGLTNKAEEVPENGSGYALKVETTSNGYPGAFLTPTELPQTGIEYTFSAELRAVTGSKTFYCNFSVNGKNMEGSPSITLKEGESGTISRTVVFPADMTSFRLEFFAINDPNAETVVFTVDNIVLKVAPNISIVHPENDIANLEDGTLTLTADTNVDGQIEWTSSETGVARFDGTDGTLTLVGTGETVITASVGTGEDKISDSFTLRVVETGVFLPYREISLQVGDTVYLDITLSGEMTGDLIAESEDEGIVLAEIEGGKLKLTAVGDGMSVVTVSKGGYEADIDVESQLSATEDFESATVSGNSGAGAKMTIASDNGATLSLTQNAEYIPDDCGGNALLVEHTGSDNTYPGASFYLLDSLQVGATYEFGATVKAISGVTNIYMKLENNNDGAYNVNTGILVDGQTAKLTNRITISKENPQILIFIVSKTGATEKFSIDDVYCTPIPEIEIQRPQNDRAVLEDGTLTLTADSNVALPVVWTSSVETVAKFEGKDGTLTLIGTGTTVITAKITAGGKEYSDSFTLEVVGTGIFLSDQEISLKGGATGYVDIVVSGQIDGDLTVEVVDDGIASAVIEGEQLKITGLSEGMTVVNVIKGDYSASIDVNVWTAIAEYFENVTQNGTGYEGNAFNTAVKEGAVLSITEDEDKVPEGGSGKALLVEHTGKDWTYPGATITTKEKLVIGAEYEFTLVVRAISDVSMIYVKLEGNNSYSSNSGTLTAGQSAVITKTITVSKEFPQIEVFIASAAGKTESFSIDNVLIQATEQAAILGRPDGDTVRQDAGSLQLAWQMMGGATAESATWESSQPEVADIDQQGLVTPKSGGKTTITLTAGAYSASFELSVVSVTEIASENFDGDFVLAEATEGAKPVSGSSETSGLTFSTVGFELQHSENPDHLPAGGSGKCLFWQPYNGDNVWGSLNITGVPFEVDKVYEVSFKVKLINHTAAVSGFNFFVELYGESGSSPDQKVEVIPFAEVGDTVDFAYTIDLTGASFTNIKIFLSVQNGAETQIAIDDFSVIELGA